MNQAIFLCILFFLTPLFAIDGKIKVFIPAQESIYTSQKISVSVEVLSSAFSITNVQITFPPSDKYMVQSPRSASYLGREEVGDEAWQMVHYDYDLYALHAGAVEIPAVLVTFTASMGYGQPQKEFSLQSEALHFEVKSPPGVNSNQFILVTDQYRVESQMKPERGKLIVGDAVELRVTQKANGVPDVLLRPVQYSSNPFIRIYNKEPKLQSELKGTHDVSRTDTFTFVASVEGNVTLPSQAFYWWDSVNKKVHLQSVPEISFEILPDPQIAIDAKKRLQQQRLYDAFAIITGLILLYVLFGKKVKKYINERKRLYLLSEEGRFKRLIASCHDQPLKEVYHNFYSWLKVVDSELATAGFKGVSGLQPSFVEVLEHFDNALVSSQYSMDRETLMEELKKLRATLLKKQHQKLQQLPQKINPD